MKRVARGVKALVAASILVVSLSTAWAQDSEPANPCTSPEYSQFDFWVGDWQDAFLGISTRAKD